RSRGRSSSSPKRGTTSVAATTKSSASAASRRRSCGRPSRSSSHAPRSRTNEKLATSPPTIARGRRRPPLAEPARRIGSTGSTHGEIAVTTPATNPIPSRTSIRCRPSVPGNDLGAAHRLSDPSLVEVRDLLEVRLHLLEPPAAVALDEVVFVTGGDDHSIL